MRARSRRKAPPRASAALPVCVPPGCAFDRFHPERDGLRRPQARVKEPKRQLETRVWVKSAARALPMLADIYNWFTEGFDTADLKDAKALLDELNG